MSGTRSCFQGKPGSKRSSLSRPPGGSISGWMSASPRPADACPLPDRALANVLLLRVVVIYILSVYINLSAAALAALLQSACLLGSLGDFPHRRPGGCRGNWAAKFLRPANNNKRPLRRSPAAWSRTWDAERCARPWRGRPRGDSPSRAEPGGPRLEVKHLVANS